MGKPPGTPEPMSANSDHVLVTMATRLKERRQRLKLTQKQLAEMAGLQHSYVYEIETGKANTTLRTLARLAEVLQVDIRALLPETGPGVASADDGSMLSAVLGKTVAVLQEWQKQDAERHSALLEELKSVVGLREHVEPRATSMHDLTSAKEPRPEADTTGI